MDQVDANVGGGYEDSDSDCDHEDVAVIGSVTEPVIDSDYETKLERYRRYKEYWRRRNELGSLRTTNYKRSEFPFSNVGSIRQVGSTRYIPSGYYLGSSG